MNASTTASRLPWALRALGSRNFRLFFSGQIVSLTGSWISSTANSWLVYHLTGSTALLGLSAFAAQIPAFILAPFAGVLVDRWNLRKALIITQAMSLLQSFLLAVLCWSDGLSQHAMVVCIMGLQLFQGIINAADLPARQSFGVQMVDKREDLPNAIALSSTMVNVSRAIGPAVAGGLIALAMGAGYSGVHGAAWCYTLDAVSYVGVIWALLIMRPTPILRAPRQGDFGSQFLEGFRYVAQHPALRTALLLLCATSFFGVSINSQLAAISRDILHVDAAGYGWLVACVGLGATCSAIYLANRRSTAGLPRLVSYASLTFGLAVIAMAFTSSYHVALLLTPILGGAMILQSAGTNTLCQTLAADDKRGRVMAFFTMSFMGMVPLGALTLGQLSVLSARNTIFAFGSVVVLASLIARSRLLKVCVGMPAQATPPHIASAGDEPEPEPATENAETQRD